MSCLYLSCVYGLSHLKYIKYRLRFELNRNFVYRYSSTKVHVYFVRGLDLERN